jgi:hypothetical protein
MEESPPMIERAVNRVRAVLEPAMLASALRRGLMHSDRSRGIYPVLAELAGRWGATPGLTAHELRVFSQNGEDGVLAEIFRRIGVGGGGFVEFGASDGAEGNSAFLAQVLGWPGVLLEPGDEAYAALAHRYRASPRVRTVQAAVEPGNVEALFAQTGVPEEPDLLSIDVDGNDYWIWQAIERHRARVVVVEYNGGLDPLEPRVMPYTPGFRWDHTTGYGASLATLEALGAAKGYRLVHTELAGVNAFFVREDLADPLPSGDDVPRRTANQALLGLGHLSPRREPDWVEPG